MDVEQHDDGSLFWPMSGRMGGSSSIGASEGPEELGWGKRGANKLIRQGSIIFGTPSFITFNFSYYFRDSPQIQFMAGCDHDKRPNKFNSWTPVTCD